VTDQDLLRKCMKVSLRKQNYVAVAILIVYVGHDYPLDVSVLRRIMFAACQYGLVEAGKSVPARTGMGRNC